MAENHARAIELYKKLGDLGESNEFVRLARKYYSGKGTTLGCCVRIVRVQVREDVWKLAEG